MSSALLAAALREDLSPGPLPGAGVAMVERARVSARALLRRQGTLADARSERWRYMPLRALEAQALPLADSPSNAALAQVPGTPFPRLVFVDGHYAAAHSRTSGVPAGIRWLPLAEFAAADWEACAELLMPTVGDDALDALNLALAQGGFVLDVPAGLVVEQPLEVLYLSSSTRPTAWHVRSLVRLGAGARLTLRERHLGNGSGLASVHTRRSLGEGASLAVLQQQEAPTDLKLLRRDAFALGARSHLLLHVMELGAGLSRQDLAIRLAGAEATVELRQAALLTGRQHSEMLLDLVHAVGGTRCDLRCRAVASDRARAVLHGAVTIAAGADGSDAALSTQNLLLSDQAEIDARPTMEIHADEVRAAHGASVGQLDAGMLFYLRTRGIRETEARALLTAAHCRALLEDIAHPVLRADAEAALDARVGAMG